MGELGLKVAMSTDRNWGTTGLSRKGRDWIASTLTRGRRKLKVFLSKSDDFVVSFTGGDNQTVKISGKLGSNDWQVSMLADAAETKKTVRKPSAQVDPEFRLDVNSLPVRSA